MISGHCRDCEVGYVCNVRDPFVASSGAARPPSRSGSSSGTRCTDGSGGYGGRMLEVCFFLLEHGMLILSLAVLSLFLY